MATIHNGIEESLQRLAEFTQSDRQSASGRPERRDDVAGDARNAIRNGNGSGNTILDYLVGRHGIAREDEQKFYARIQSEFIGREGEFVAVICLDGNGTKPDSEPAPHDRVSIALGVVNGERWLMNLETWELGMPVSMYVRRVEDRGGRDTSQFELTGSPIVIPRPHDAHLTLQHALKEDRFWWRVVDQVPPQTGHAVAVLVGDDTLTRFLLPYQSGKTIERYRNEYLPGLTESLCRMSILLGRPLASVRRLQEPLEKRWQQLHEPTIMQLVTQYRELTKMANGAVPGARIASNEIKETMPAIAGLKLKVQAEITRAELFGMKSNTTVLAAQNVVNEVFDT